MDYPQLEDRIAGLEKPWTTNVPEIEVFRNGILPPRIPEDKKVAHHDELDFNDVICKSHGDVDQITQHIYICNMDAAKQQAVYAEIGIGARLNISSSKLLANLHNLNINIKDEPDVDISQFFDLTYEFLTWCISKNLRVLINCRAGISRSPTIVLAFLMRRYDLSFDIADHYLKSRRSCIKPNLGFVKQLIEYRASLDKCVKK